jgi:hypothetical protein
MAAIPVQNASAEPSVESVEERFKRLACDWEEAVAYQSSTTLRNSHPAYRAIVALGPEVIPYLLRDMETNQTHWFAALREITGADPVPTSAAGNVPKVIQAWLDWGRDNDYQW